MPTQDYLLPILISDLKCTRKKITILYWKTLSAPFSLCHLLIVSA